MERYLLYDSGCSMCSKMARAIEQEVDGQLTARSLHDPDIQNLLNQANPHWQWKPTLLEVSDNTVRAYTGLAMGMRLVLELGPCQALRLVKLVNRYSVSAIDMGPPDPGRRHFLRQSGSAFAAIAVLLGWPNSQLFGNNIGAATPEQTTSHQALQESTEGEIWEGFLLLPTPDAPLPLSVRFARDISLHGGIDPSLEGETLEFGSPEELTASLPFPIFVLGKVPHGLALTDASIIRYKQSRGIWAATITYGTHDNLGALDRRITLVAQTEYARPHPIWPVRDPRSQLTAEDPEERYVPPEKVSFASVGPGVMLPTADGHMLQWIQRNILYTLVAEHDQTRSAIDSLAESLVRA